MAEKGTSNKEHPLAGVVLCFTSILPEQRTDISTIATQMGATIKLDLTSDVTHLLVGEVNTSKYKFVARERADVIVLKPEWIEAVRQSWMQGEDTDVRALEEQYKLLTFAGLSICLTGFEDMGFRNYIESTVTANGAEFHKDLTKHVTHLIARTAEGQKYKFATQWNIKVVSGKWLRDSIERGMVLEETLYHPLLSEEQQGAGAWNKALPAPKKKSQAGENSANPRPRKLRRIASAKLEGQNSGIWGDIVGAGFDSSEPNASKSNNERVGDSIPPRAVSVIQEAKSFASESTFAEAQDSHRRLSESMVNDSKGFLHGTYFLIYGFSQKQRTVLQHHLASNGAQLVDSMSDFARPDIPKTGDGLYIIVSHKTPVSQIPSTDDLAFECEVVTDMWLERCLDARALVPPEANVASTPIPKFPIPGFNGMRICSTGFARIDLLHLSKLVALIGASYNEYLTPSASVLICNDPQSMNREKLRHTYEWGVPTLSAEWLWISIQAGQKKPFEPYLVRKPLSRSSSRALERGSGSQAENEYQSQHFVTENGDTQPATNHNLNGATEPNATLPERSTTTSQKQSKPVYGDGFMDERPETQPTQPRKSTIPESTTPSPTKETKDQPNDTSTNNHENTAKPTDPTPQSAFTLAVSGLLKQAREAKSRAATDSTETHNEYTRPIPRRRKPLTGKGRQNTFSRASSIDTLNEDGCGSAIESNGPTRTNSRNGQSFKSILNDGPFDDSPFLYNDSDQGARIQEEDEENEEPAMTQLNYEDPDAVAMREQFLSHVGKLKPGTKRRAEDIGEIKEMEDVGWGTGRRTRNAGKAA